LTAARPGALQDAPLPDAPQERELVSRFATAFQAGDIRGVVQLLTDDALMTMPPEAAEYQGPEAIERFLSTVPAAGQLEPAFGCYLKDPHTPIAHAYGLMVLTLRGGRVAGLAGFADTRVFASFGLPRTLRE
jgi:ketosteroid isomerase-like protein